MMEISWQICKRHKKIKKKYEWSDIDFQTLLALLLATGKGTYYIDIVENECPECAQKKEVKKNG
jgi:hypothetical protein